MKNFSKTQTVDFLFNKKVFVGNNSEKIQKVALAAGYRWGESPKDEVKNLDKPFLFFGKSKKSDSLLITYTADMTKFNSSSKEEINAADIIDIKVQKTEAEIYAEGYKNGFNDAEDGNEYDDYYYQD